MSRRLMAALVVAAMSASALAQMQPAKPAAADDAKQIAELIAEARLHGDARRGAAVFVSPQFACISCHKVGKQGGTVGPDLTVTGKCLTPEQIVESVLWPKRQIKQGFVALTVQTGDGKVHQGYKESENDKELVLRDPATGALDRIAKSAIEERRETGTLMPDGLAQAMSPEQRRDLVRLLLELGQTAGLADTAAMHSHAPAKFPYDGAPIYPELWPNRKHPVEKCPPASTRTPSVMKRSGKAASSSSPMSATGSWTG